MTPDPTALQNYIHASKYARYMPEMQRREVYDETVDRVELMHIKRYPALRTEIEAAFKLVREQKVLPSMRSMQFGGAAIEANNSRIYNCASSLVDRPRVFAEAMFLLLSGCGVGYSVQYEHVEKLPQLSYVDNTKVVHHVIQDTIEGWAEAVDALVNAYIGGYLVEFAYHEIRDAGVPLKTSGGRAPGHRRLRKSLERIRAVLHGAQGRQLRPIECHRIMCHAADA
ncbi:MAG TPA: recombinase, partial [Candidatus Paceibacterota bacterium]